MPLDKSWHAYPEDLKLNGTRQLVVSASDVTVLSERIFVMNEKERKIKGNVGLKKSERSFARSNERLFNR
jgi:hypothetical protein